MKVINRIKKTDDFVIAIRKGRTYRNDTFIIHVIQNHQNNTRVGISVSSKLGNAVVRNRIKRQLRAMCDSLIDYNAQTLDIVIVVKNKFLEDSFNNNKHKLETIFVSEIGIKQ